MYPHPDRNTRWLYWLGGAVKNLTKRIEKLEQCHLVALGDESRPPSYCEKHTQLDKSCTCCPQCCTCGG